MDKPAGAAMSIPTSTGYKPTTANNLEVVPCVLKSADGTTGTVGYLIRTSATVTGSSNSSSGKPIAPSTAKLTNGNKMILPSTCYSNAAGSSQFPPLRPKLTLSDQQQQSSSSTLVTNSHNGHHTYLVATGRHTTRQGDDTAGPSSSQHHQHQMLSPLDSATAVINVNDHHHHNFQEPSTSGHNVSSHHSGPSLSESSMSIHECSSSHDQHSRLSIEPQLEWQQPAAHNQVPADERPTSSSSCATTTEDVDLKPKRKRLTKRRPKPPYSAGRTTTTQFADMPKLTPVDDEPTASTTAVVQSSNARPADKYASIFASVLAPGECAKAGENFRSTDDESVNESVRTSSRNSIAELAERIIVDKDPKALASSLMQNLDEKQLRQLTSILGSSLLSDAKALSSHKERAESTMLNSDTSSPQSAACCSGTTNMTTSSSPPPPTVAAAGSDAGDDTPCVQVQAEQAEPATVETLSMEQRLSLARLRRYRRNAQCTRAHATKDDIARLISKLANVHMPPSSDVKGDGPVRVGESKPSCFLPYSELKLRAARAASDAMPKVDTADFPSSSSFAAGGYPLAASTPMQSPAASSSFTSDKTPPNLKFSLNDLRRRSSWKSDAVPAADGGCFADDHKLPPKKRRKRTKPIMDVVVNCDRSEEDLIDSTTLDDESKDNSFSTGVSTTPEPKQRHSSSSKRPKCADAHKLASPNCKYVDRGKYTSASSVHCRWLPADRTFCLNVVREAREEHGRSYKLPYDVWWEQQCGDSHNSPSTSYKHIKSSWWTNVYIDTPPELVNTSACACREDCGDNCLNRQLYTECTDTTCAVADQCSNRRLQKRAVCPHIVAFDTGTERGWGVRATQTIPKGTLLSEYVGEVVASKRLAERLASVYSKYRHHYALTLNGGYVIDAYRQGSVARLFNHSCQPNCQLQKWNVNGQHRIGVFTDVDIEADTELCYDYRFHAFGPAHDSHQACRCGAPNCRGTIGLQTTPSAKLLTPRQKSIVASTRVFLLRNLTIDSARLKRCRWKSRRRELRIAPRTVLAHIWHVYSEQHSLDPTAVGQFDDPRAFDAAVKATIARLPVEYSRSWQLVKQKSLLLLLHACAQHQRTVDTHAWLDQHTDAKTVNRSTHGDVLISSVIDESYLDGQVPFGVHDSDDPAGVWARLAPESGDHVRCVCGIQQEDGEMVQCDRCHYWLHSDCLQLPSSDEFVCHYCVHRTRRCPVVSIELRKQPTESLAGCTYYRTLRQPDINMQVRLDECVYVVRHISEADRHKLRLFHDSYVNVAGAATTTTAAAASAAAPSTSGTQQQPGSSSSHRRKLSRRNARVFRVDRLFTAANGEAFVFGFYYAYPHETFCEPTRRFYRKEVLCTPLYDTLPLSCVVGRCAVLHKADYVLGRPLLPHYAEDDVYVCEYRVDKHQRLFTPIRSKNSSFTAYNTASLFRQFAAPLKISRSFTPFILFNLAEETSREDGGRQLQQFRKTLAVKKIDALFNK